jgi:hypothetical protein
MYACARALHCMTRLSLHFYSFLSAPNGAKAWHTSTHFCCRLFTKNTGQKDALLSAPSV